MQNAGNALLPKTTHVCNTSQYDWHSQSRSGLCDPVEKCNAMNPQLSPNMRSVKVDEVEEGENIIVGTMRRPCLMRTSTKV